MSQRPSPPPPFRLRHHDPPGCGFGYCARQAASSQRWPVRRARCIAAPCNPAHRARVISFGFSVKIGFPLHNDLTSQNEAPGRGPKVPCCCCKAECDQALIRRPSGHAALSSYFAALALGQPARLQGSLLLNEGRCPPLCYAPGRCHVAGLQRPHGSGLFARAPPSRWTDNARALRIHTAFKTCVLKSIHFSIIWGLALACHLSIPRGRRLA